jgi:hypothetical protein
MKCDVSKGLHARSVYLVLSFPIQTKQTSWLLVRKRTIPTERPPLVGEFLVPTFGGRWVSRQRDGSLQPSISIFYTGVATFL